MHVHVGSLWKFVTLVCTIADMVGETSSKILKSLALLQQPCQVATAVREADTSKAQEIEKTAEKLSLARFGWCPKPSGWMVFGDFADLLCASG